MAIILTAVSLAAVTIGAGYAYQGAFSDQATSPGTITIDPASVAITTGDWNDLKEDGSNTVTVQFRDPQVSSEVHPEFAFSGMNTDLSSYDYVKIHLEATGSGNTGTYDFYASTSSVTGTSGDYSLSIIGTSLTTNSSGTWTGTMSITLGGTAGSATVYSVMGGTPTMTIASYHLEGTL